MRARLAAVIAVISILAGLGQAAASDQQFNPPKRYYLALGDSQAFGFQQAKFVHEVATHSYDPRTFNSGYVDGFAAHMLGIDPGIETVNLSCPGESSASFLGRCAFHFVRGFALHADYPGSQHAAALELLRSHHGLVSPITIDLGSNDLRQLWFTSCKLNPSCIAAGLPATLDAFRANFDQILDDLRSASPNAEIILMQYPNPYALKAPFTTESRLALNQVIADVAATHRARLADMYPDFNLGPQPQTLCTLTFICIAPLFDDHPTDAGYQVMAQQFWMASGYDRLDR